MKNNIISVQGNAINTTLIYNITEIQSSLFNSWFYVKFLNQKEIEVKINHGEYLLENNGELMKPDEQEKTQVKIDKAFIELRDKLIKEWNNNRGDIKTFNLEL